jgi:hypothetical protein
MDRVYLSLDATEQVVAHCASRIFAAYVGSGQVHDENEKEMIEKAVQAAIQIAKRTDQQVVSDEETG